MAQNSWNRHLKSFRRRNKAMNLEEVLKEARKSYKGGVTGVESSSLLAKNASSVGGADPKALLNLLQNKKGGTKRQSRRRQTRRSRR